MQRQHVFAGPYLDRTTHLRDDPACIEAAIADARSRAVPVWNTRSLVTAGDPPRAALLDLACLPPAQRNADQLILLGEFAGVPCFACALDAEQAPQLVADATFEDLRTLAPALSAEDAGLLGYARAMVSWRERHRYCGQCGAPTRSAKGGHVALCTNAACGAEQFPRIDPAIIVLISDGDRVLLGRQASWPAGRYSTIAGFVEIGESLEDAVVREVLEETGVPVDRIEYHSSQPWPFPASLMLGFTAHALATDVQRKDQELEDARWFSRDEIITRRVLLPPGQSISFRLIEHWFDAGSRVSLREVVGAHARR
ncbi:MAG: NAD(+) diphosphatase [Steroidobacterales bacterium]